jgi:hypothetical protein
MMDASSGITRETAAQPQLPAWPVLSWSAHVAAAWALAGGAAGGTLVAALLLAGRMHPDGSAIIAMLIATVGGVLGLVHGAVLGYLGRHADAAGDEEVQLRLRDRIGGATFAAGALVAAVAIAVWIVMSAVLVRSGSTWGWLALAAGGALTLVSAAWATLLGWESLEKAYEEWPEHRLGALLLGGTFALLSVVFLALRPAIPGTAVQLAPVGWVAVAALATIWIATPAIVLALRYGTRRAPERIVTHR